MDEKIRETIDYVRYTLEHAPDVETLEWETGVVRDLLSKIEESEKRLHKAAGDISLWREQQNDSCKRVKKLVEGIEKVLEWRGLDGDGISDPLRKELYKLIEKEKL